MFIEHVCGGGGVKNMDWKLVVIIQHSKYITVH